MSLISLFLYCTSRSRAVSALLHILVYGHNSGFSFLTANGSMYVLLEYVSLPRSSDVPECPRVACINSTYSIVGNETANLHSLGLGKITGLGSCFSKGVRVLPAPCTSDVVLRGSI